MNALAALRERLEARQLDACLVLSADPHLSEYLPEHWQVRRFLSGFDGSAGELLVTADFAGLWVDSRYWSAAERQLEGSGIRMMKLQPGSTPVAWAAEHLSEGARLAVDGRTLSLDTTRRLGDTLRPKGIELLEDFDPAEGLWNDRPPLPEAPVYAHDAPFASESRAQKLARLRARMAEKGCQWHLISALDDLAWLLNLRGSDVEFNPVFLAHALVGQDEFRLFANPSKFDLALRQQLAEDGVQLLPYEAAADSLASLPAGSRLLVDPLRVTRALLAGLGEGVERVDAHSPCQLFKASKSDADAAHVRQAMEQDGAALCEFFTWFDETITQRSISELEVAERLRELRARRPDFVGLSFATIAGFNANGALPHYRATEASHSQIEGDGLLLIDSGGQYLGGTTDITRMVPVGHPSAAQKRDCTLVLKGVIGLSRARYPEGISAPLLDALARAPLWAEGLDFGHGTGHGVGYFLNVHEGPQSIAFRAPVTPERAMRKGMITSIEPGLYREGEWGVRIENLVLNVEAAEGFLAFETLTLCPIDTRCLEPALLELHERAWLDAYHREVRQRLSPLLEGAALAWLTERTQALG